MFFKFTYRIYLAIRRGFPLSRMSTNHQLSRMQFCCNTSFTLPKQSQRSRSILLLGLFWKKTTTKKTRSYKQKNTVSHNLFKINIFIPGPLDPCSFPNLNTTSLSHSDTTYKIGKRYMSCIKDYSSTVENHEGKYLKYFSL